MGKFIDLTGQRFGKLVVIKRDGSDKSKHSTWLCQCDCGNTIIYTCNNLKRGSRIKHCGCLNNHDLTGRKFGKLTALKAERKDKFGHCIWLCKCDCGNVKSVLATHLIRGNIRSCGCLRLDNRKNILTQCNIDLDTYIRLHHILAGMKRRCNDKNDKNFKNYGNRGIKICDEWLERQNKGIICFCNWAMQNGYRNDLTIDRIDVNGNYEPSNCRWVTLKEQENNRRDNVFLKYNGKIKTLKQWSEIIDIPYNTLYSRYSREIELLKKHIIEQINVSKILYKNDLRRRKK